MSGVGLTAEHEATVAIGAFDKGGFADFQPDAGMTQSAAIAVAGDAMVRDTNGLWGVDVGNHFDLCLSFRSAPS